MVNNCHTLHFINVAKYYNLIVHCLVSIIGDQHNIINWAQDLKH